MPRSEDVQVLGQRQHRLDHVQAVHPRRVDLEQRLREEVGLLLVVALEADAVTRFEHGLEQRHGIGVGDVALPGARAGTARGARQALVAVACEPVPAVVEHGALSRP